MSSRQIREGIRALLTTGNGDAIPREQKLAILELLSDNMFYTVTGLERSISEWSDEHGAGNYLHNTDFNFINGSVSSLKALDSHLDDFGLPPLREWEDALDYGGDPGAYSTNVIEDENGYADPGGSYIVDYTIRVELEFSTPLLPDEIQS